MSLLHDVLDQLDIVEEIGKRVKLKKTGSAYKGFCPFHENVNTPAFWVYPEGKWWCYGCQEGGSVLDFLTKYNDEDLSTVLRNEAKRLGVSTKPLTEEERQKKDRLDRLNQLLEDATQYFHDNLLNLPEAAGARNYLSNRGINDESIENFRLGYSLPSWTDSIEYFGKKGYSIEEMEAVGIARKGSSDWYDFFRGRIIFPIQMNGHVIGFAGRIVYGKSTKYINSPNTEFFSKKKVLFGLAQARQEIRHRNSVVIVEGYMDVVALHQEGFENTVGIMGISLTKEQAETLSYHTNRLTIALDPDEAGEKAIEKMNFENLGMDVYVAQLPLGKDPDELVIKSIDIWMEVLMGAKPIPMYLTDYYIKKYQPSDPKERRMVFDKVRPVIDLVKDVNEQAGYQQYLAEALGYKNYTINVRCPHCGRKYNEDI